MTAIPRAYDEMVDFIISEISPQKIIAFKASNKLQKRVEKLINQEKSGQISEDEKSELDHYMFLEHIIILAKAQAHKKLLV